MHKSGSCHWEVIDFVEDKIAEDLMKALGTDNVSVAFLDEHDRVKKPLPEVFKTVEEYTDPFSITFDQYNEDPRTLKLVVSDEVSWEFHHSAALRSNCRVTNQPDWGDY